MNTGIFELGYVGAVSLARLAREGHGVIGVDVDPAKLQRIADGKTPVVEEGMVELMAKVVAGGRVAVTSDAAQAIRDSELSLICVGTPSAANGSQDQSAILRLCEQMGAALRGVDRPRAFVLRATPYLAKQHDVDLPMHAGILPSNRAHIDRAIAKVLETGKRRVGMIGLAFKTGTDDLRESPLVLLAEHLLGKGLSLLVYDPEVHLSNLLGANRKFIESHVPHIGGLIRRDLEPVIAESDVLVVGLNDKKTIELLKRHARGDQVVIDLVNIGAHGGLHAKYVGLCW